LCIEVQPCIGSEKPCFCTSKFLVLTMQNRAKLLKFPTPNLVDLQGFCILVRQAFKLVTVFS